MSYRPKLRGDSPWGPIQSIDEIPGSGGELLSIDTPGHGGYWLGPAYAERLRRCCPNWRPFAGYPWLEEDCDAAVAPLVFPELFDDDARQRASVIVFAPSMDTYFKEVRDYLYGQQRPAEFREEYCGGAFDGFTVSSDADPGL